MTKRSVVVFFFAWLVGLTVWGSPDPALALFGDQRLIQVVYSPTSNELAKDFGAIGQGPGELDLGAGNLAIGNAGSIRLDFFPAVDDWEGINVSYYSYDAATYSCWFATSSPAAPGINVTALNSFVSAGSLLRINYDETGANPALTSAAADNSFVNRMNSISGKGVYAGLNPDVDRGTASLAPLGSGGYVDMYLYHYDVNVLDKGPDPSTDYYAVVRVNADGSTVLNPAAGDGDGDGVLDDVDNCPDTSNAGQEDTDDDGAGDACDSCPQDGAKIEPGQCGCGIPDTDTDSDQTADCMDDDDDDDGMPDAWEETFGLDPLNDGDAPLDKDADGFSNYQEYVSGTLPDDDGDAPVRPAAHAGDPQTVTEGDVVTLWGAQTPGTNPVVQRRWAQVDGDPPVTLAGADTLTATFTAPAVTGNIQLVFELVLVDSVGIASLPSTVTVTVQPSGFNHVPTAPSLNAPPNEPESACQVDTVTPVLSVNNGEDQDPADVLSYEFQVADDEAFTQIVVMSSLIPEGENTTAYTVDSPLAEDRFYYWRARAYDGTDFSAWMAPAKIFINAVNSAPTPPVNSLPMDGAVVATPRPRLQVTNSQDSDAYDTRIYQFQVFADEGLTVPAGQSPDVVELSGGNTSWTVADALMENNWYWWRARAVDNHGEAGGWSDAAAFYVNAQNVAPTVPEMINPPAGGEIPPDGAVLTVSNAVDADFDQLVYYFEIDTRNTFDGPELLQSGELAEGANGSTSWMPGPLEDNTAYYWRAIAYDGQANSESWATGSFFTNAENDPPTMPVPTSPADDSQVGTLAPTLRVTPSTDVDGDALHYLFELYEGADWNVPIAEYETAERFWTIRIVPLENRTTYFWRVRAWDEHGTPGAWTAMQAFTTAANYYRPTVPVLQAPYSGAVVATATPALRVSNALDEDGDALTYTFEIYGDAALSDFVSQMDVNEGDGTTAAPPGEPLTDGGTYYWRVRADDGLHTGAWMPTASFAVDLSGGDPAMAVTIVYSAIADAHADKVQSFIFSGPPDSLDGLRVDVPPGALTEDMNLTIGTVETGPAIPDDASPLGPLVFIGPEGAVFAQPVTVWMPITQGIDGDADDMEILAYRNGTGAWERLPVLEVNASAVKFEVDYFSLFTPVKAADDGTGGGDGGNGGGGSGCFIDTLVFSF